MRFYLILFFCVSVLFISCSEKEIPDDVVPIHEMAALLTDIHIVDGSLYDIPQQMDTLSKHSLGMYMAVFKSHHVDTGLFRKSITFYSSHPKILNQIYVGIEQRLQKKIDSLQKHKPKVDTKVLARLNLQKKVDSVKLVKDKLKADSVRKFQLKNLLKKNKRKYKNPHALPQQ